MKQTKRLGDVKYFINRVTQEIELLLMDKLYNSEKLHKMLRERRIYSFAPIKKN